MTKTDAVILKNFPLQGYEADRLEYGHMELVSKVEQRTLAEGVTYEVCLYKRGDGVEVWVYITRISPDAPVQLAVNAAPLWTAKFVKDHAADFQRTFHTPVLYAMNASYFHFFNAGDLTPFGIQVVRGVEMARPGLVKEKPWYGYNFLAVDWDGKAFISDADQYNSGLRGTLAYAVGGGMRLIRDGQIYLYSDPLNGDRTYAPRTAVGFTEDGATILLCADGRSKRSGGLAFADLIELYLQQGCIRELLNLDGGGSTTVVLPEDGAFRVQNVPSGIALPCSRDRYGLPKIEPRGDEQARPVADAILLIPKEQR